jgi:hypothetical protein
MTSLVQHAQAAHVLAVVGIIAGQPGLLDAARWHLDTTLAQQTPCGWFPDATGPVSTVALASIVRSLIETSRLSGDERARRAALRAVQGLRGLLRGDGWLTGAFDDGWMPAGSHVCVTGLAQLAVCWLRLAQVEQDTHWRDPAWRALARVKHNQRTDDLALCGALPDTVPIWAGPATFSFDILGVKHFAGALMMEMVGITIPPVTQKVATP